MDEGGRRGWVVEGDREGDVGGLGYWDWGGGEGGERMNSVRYLARFLGYEVRGKGGVGGGWWGWIEGGTSMWLFGEVLAERKDVV